MSTFDMAKPPMIDNSDEPPYTYIVYAENCFNAYLNKASLFEFRVGLWFMSTSLPLYEDISLSSDALRVDVREQVVPYCEFVLVGEGRASRGFSKKKENYRYSSEVGRVDFEVSRDEAKKMYLTVDQIYNFNHHRTEVTDNFWINLIASIY